MSCAELVLLFASQIYHEQELLYPHAHFHLHLFHPTQLSVGKTKYLEAISIGTLSVTTVNCAAYGVKAGRKVKIHVVGVDTNELSLGGTVR